jgi:hypothetical protein
MNTAELIALEEMRDNWQALIHHTEASNSDEEDTFAEGVRFCIGELDMFLEGVEQ